jgi:prepilin-type N-terminal cleavage/methylation domain-containing protein/prepilin-type processing-associated H-X9-DG protein
MATPKRLRLFERARAFTLVELLVVISLIAILLAMLMPALGGVQERVNTMKCLHNMRQIATAVLKYSAENDGVILPSGYSYTAEGESWKSYGGQRFYWPCILVKYNYIGAPNTFDLVGVSSQTTEEENVFRCPSGRDEDVNWAMVPNPAADELQGFVRYFQPHLKIAVDCWYYWNGDTYLLDFPGNRIPSDGGGNSRIQQWIRDPLQFYRGLDEIKKRTKVVMITDGVAMNGVRHRTRIAARHLGDYGPRSATNICYWDGHAETYVWGEDAGDDWDGDWEDDPLGICLLNGLYNNQKPLFRLSDQERPEPDPEEEEGEEEGENP